jgi:hypothetical protein
LTTKERLSTAPPATNIPSIHTISESARNWDGKRAAVKNLCKADSLETKELMPVPVFSAGVERKIRMIVWRYGRPMQACRPFGNITLHGHGL